MFVYLSMMHLQVQTFFFQREEQMVMFANDRLYSFAKVVEHEDNNVFQTNDKTVVYIRTILKK